MQLVQLQLEIKWRLHLERAMQLKQWQSLYQMDAVELYYDNTLRFQTSGIGVTVTGETKTTTLNVTGITTTNNLNVTGTATIASIGSTVGISSNFYFGDDNRINLEMVMI